MRDHSSGDGQVSGHRLAEDPRGKKRRRNHESTNPLGLGKHPDLADGTTDANVDSHEYMPTWKQKTKKRFLWSALGLYPLSLVFFLVFALVQNLPSGTEMSSAKAVPRNERIYYRHGNLRHRRLGPGREQDEDNKHATSYAQRHHTFSHNKYSSGTNHYYYGDGYGFEQQEETKNEVHRRYVVPKTNLSDVWLCLLTTLGWTTWLFSSIESLKRAERTFSGIGDELEERFACHRGSVLLVKGHVLQVSRADNDSMGYNIPTYTAVIDYMVESEKTNESLQIRKHFETQQVLEQGFANVELLVLPEEPTRSILKDDYDQHLRQEKHMQMLEQERKKRKNISSFDSGDVNDDPWGEILDGGYCNKKCKRMTVALAVILVLASIGGTVQVVLLMEDDERWKGWLSFVVGLLLDVPVALLIYWCAKSARGWSESSEKHGYIVQSSTMNGSVRSPDHQSTTKGTATLADACMPPSCSELMGGICDRDGKYNYSEVVSYVVPEMGGCYFVRCDNGRKERGAACSPANREITACPKLPVDRLLNNLTPPAEGSGEVEGEISRDRSSTSSVSSLSSGDHAENVARGSWINPNDSH